MPTRPAIPPCPCGGPSLDTCCGPFIEGSALPATAEALMRSRYTAYSLKNEPYLLATWHPSTRPTEPIVDEKEPIRWLGLEVKSALRLRQRKVIHRTIQTATPSSSSPASRWVDGRTGCTK